MTEEGKATADDGKATAEDKSEPVRPNNESASPSRAKRWKVSDTIVAAAITAGLGAIATVAVAVISHSSDQKTQPPTTTSIAPPPTTAARGPAGSISQIEIDTGGLHVTISPNQIPRTTLPRISSLRGIALRRWHAPRSAQWSAAQSASGSD